MRRAARRARERLGSAARPGDIAAGSTSCRRRRPRDGGESGPVSRAWALHGPPAGGRHRAHDPDSTPPFGPRYEAWRAGRDDVAFSVGNYWPHATTLFDYIRRAMPSDAPGTLAADEVYGLVAWILAENGIIAPDAVMNPETLPAVEMPARDIFVPQER